MQRNRYPKLYIRSKNELAKHMSHKEFSKDKALKLINDVLANGDAYWKDSKRSEPEKQKYVRNAKGTPLGKLLRKINEMVLAPHDSMLPPFVFGGVKGTSHAHAAEYLLGKKRKRTLLKIDLTRFFEQISEERVAHFFQDKCKCDQRAAKLLSTVCCVPIGPKGSGEVRRTVGRGFATSSRLAIWCNLDIFLRLYWLVQKSLKGRDPRIAIYVDDIGISATHTSKEEMEKLRAEIEQLLLTGDRNQSLPMNHGKTRIVSYKERMEHLGLKLNKNSLSLGAKTRARMDRLKARLKRGVPSKQRPHLRRKYKALHSYKRFIESTKS